MDPDAQQYLEEVAKKTIDVAEKSGFLKRIASWRPSRRQELPVQPMDYRQEALLALQENAVETLASLSLTVREAVQILEPNFLLDDLDKVNSTWQKHWTEGASNVGLDDDERRTWWASLLAGEIRQPGNYSLRTLAVMDILSTKEAKLFTKVCEYVWHSRNAVMILPPDSSSLWKPDFADGALLESAGLAKFDPIAGFNFRTNFEDTTGSLDVRTKQRLSITFGCQTYIVEGDYGEQVKLRCGPLALTDVGEEMYRLTTPTYKQFYRDELLQEWCQSYTVTVR